MKPFNRAFRSRPAFALGALLLALTACEQVEQVQDRFRDQTPHERYLAGLSSAGLTQTALVHDWIAASRRAVEEATVVSLPFQEEGFIAPEEAGAVAYRLTIPRGRKLTARITVTSSEDTRVFVDLFRVPADAADALRPVFSADSIPGEFQYEPWRGGDFLLRLQPELLRGGRYRVVLRLEAQLAFPVEGRDERAIQSVFGADREAGRRTHEGVDIFARRGTPVLATADGVVRNVALTDLGGKVVWLRDPVRNAAIYFAHLDSQAVRSGQRVHTGDTLGFVGNTGNARTTPPHLHFGIYRRGEGAVDPAPFLRRPRGTLEEIDADLDRLGRWVRITDGGIRIRSGPSLRADVVGELGRYTPVRVMGASSDWVRVRLPDGRAGFVAERLTESADDPVETRIASAGGRLLVDPVSTAPVILELGVDTEVPVLGRFEDYLYVRGPTGRRGWLGAGGR